MTRTGRDGGRVPGSREVSRGVMRAKRADLEEGARGGTWFPHVREAQPTDGAPETEAVAG